MRVGSSWGTVAIERTRDVSPSTRRHPHERWQTPGALRRVPNCTPRGWRQEAAYRLLNNNLDPEVGEDPESLVVYGGTGRAARSWDAYGAICSELLELDDDETLLVQSGKPVGRFRTHERALPRAHRELEPRREVGQLGPLPRTRGGG